MIITTAQQLSNWLQNRGNVLAWDTESEDGLNYLAMKLAGFSIYDGKEICYVNCWQNPEYQKIISLWTKFIQTSKHVLIMSQASYDMKCLYKYFGIKDGFEPICTVTAEKLIDDTEYNYGLKDLTRIKLGRDVMDFKDAIKFGFNSPQFAQYGENDSINCWDVWQIQKEQLKEQNLEYLFFDVEMPFQFVIAEMERNGVIIDQVQREFLASEVAKRLYDIEEQMLQIFGKTHEIQKGLYEDSEYVLTPINFNSNLQLIERIESLGFKITEYTKGGKEKRPEERTQRDKSVGKETLLALRTEHKFINFLWLFKKLQKLQSTYVAALRNTDSDGRIRASYNLVRSGRVTCAPFQQLPNYKKEENKEIGINFRKVLIPTKGYKFVCADFAGQELRVGAHVCNCKGLIKAFNENKDPHLMTANNVFNLELSDRQLTIGTDEYKEAIKKYESERDVGKNGLNFPIMYGTTPGGISKRKGVSYQEAKKWINNFFKSYPEIKISIDKTKEELYNNGYVVDMMGRRRRYPDYKTADKSKKEFYERSAFNHKIQSPSAAMAKIAATKTLELCDKFDARILIFLHDELVFELKSEQCEDFVKELKPIMCGCLSLKVPIDVDCKIKETF